MSELAWGQGGEWSEILEADCHQQPNGVDCGVHAILNALSIATHLGGAPCSMEEWVRPEQGPRAVKKFRQEHAAFMLGLPEC